MKIAWERHGKGAPLLLIHGLGYARWGWEPVVEPLARSFDVILFDNRGVGESDAPPGPYTAAELADDAVQVLDEAGVERAHVVGTSLGGMVAQELALGHPERVERLVLACTTPGGPQAFPMPQRSVDLMQARATLREYVENALEPDPRPELVDRILEHRERTAQRFEPWAAQAAAGAASTRTTGWAASRRRRSSSTATATWSSTRGTADLLVAAIPDARLSVYPGLRPPLHVAGARSGSCASWRSSSCERELTLGRWIRDRARTTPARVAIDFRGAETTYAELDERSERLAAGLLDAGLAPGDRVATLTGTSPEHVVVFFACAKAGLILMPLNTRLAEPELRFQLAGRRAGRAPVLGRVRRAGREPARAHRRPGGLAVA